MMKNTKYRVIALACALTGGVLVFAGSLTGGYDCEESRRKMDLLEVQEIRLLDNFGKIRKMAAHIADDPVEQANGYQFICREVISKSVILFRYPGPVNRHFHMKNVEAPLDIGFFDAKGGLFSTMVMDTYADGNQRVYSPDRPFQYALEAPAGFFGANHLAPRKARLVTGPDVNAN
ncbi:MAG: DUF192 domain-containing protein [Gammaproteobacteria bacterium]|nr:DUF192 domain-containing protein [Gammaproteobacteria bacterium]